MKIITVLFILLSVLSGGDINNNSEDNPSAVVFIYHRFGEARYPSTNITLEQFERHLDYLEKNNFAVWPLSKIVRHIRDGKSIPENTVALSADDAYISVYTKAYPMLKKRGFPLTVFVNTLPVDHNSKNYMSWEQMREMSSNGIEFANHSLSHDFLLPRENESEDEWKKRLKHEIEGAQIRLQQELGDSTNENPRLFSYPFGEYTMQTAEFIKSLGYIGITQTSGPVGLQSDTMRLKRFPMSESFAKLDSFSLKAKTLVMPIESISPLEPLVGSENPPTLTIKLKFPLKDFRCYLSNAEVLKLKWNSDTEVIVQAKRPLYGPRDHYTCTAPAGDGRWFWYSHLWIIK